MRTHRRSIRAALGVAVAVVALVTTACGASGDQRSSSTTSTGGASSTPPLDGGVTVFAASSLTEAFTAIGKDFEAEHPGTTVTFNFGASSELADGIVDQGAPADVFASADEQNMQTLTDADAAAAPVVFARNRLAILVQPGNPKGIEALDDLDEAGVSYVLCAAEVPCGTFGQQLVDRAGVKAKPVSYEENVKAVVSRVALKEADAGIVYVTDAKAAQGEAEGVDIPEDQNVVAAYPIAVTKRSGNPALARAFVAFVTGPEGQRVLRRAGFLPPS